MKEGAGAEATTVASGSMHNRFSPGPQGQASEVEFDADAAIARNANANASATQRGTYSKPRAVMTKETQRTR